MGNENEVVYLYLDDIIPNRFQPREVFEDKALKELAVSIKEHGVIQPIIVRRIGSKYEIIAGERRYKASTMVGLTKIPAIIKNMDDKESSKVALIENLQRKDLTPIEEARTYQKILDLDNLTQEELAKTMGKSQSAVSNKLRLLTLPEEVQDALLHEEISERHARSLLNLNDPAKQVELLRRIILSRMTVRELDKEIKEIQANNKENATNEIPKPQMEPQNNENQISKEPDNVEFLGGINTILSSQSQNKSEEVVVPKIENDVLSNQSNNLNNKSNSFVPDLKNLQNNNEIKQKPQEELIGGGLLPNLKEPTINEPELKIEKLISPSIFQPKNTESSNKETIEILDMDSTNPTPRIIPIKSNFNSAIDSVKNLANQLKNQGYKIDINEENNIEYYQIVFRINKDR